MRTDLIVVLFPLVGAPSSVVNIDKDMSIEQLVPNAAVERLDLGVLCRLPGRMNCRSIEPLAAECSIVRLVNSGPLSNSASCVPRGSRSGTRLLRSVEGGRVSRYRLVASDMRMHSCADGDGAVRERPRAPRKRRGVNAAATVLQPSETIGNEKPRCDGVSMVAPTGVELPRDRVM